MSLKASVGSIGGFVLKKIKLKQLKSGFGFVSRLTTEAAAMDWLKLVGISCYVFVPMCDSDDMI